MLDEKTIHEIELLEKLAIDKLKIGQLTEAVDLFREAIHKGSFNFKSRLLLTKILSDMDKAKKETQFDNPEMNLQQ